MKLQKFIIGTLCLLVILFISNLFINKDVDFMVEKISNISELNISKNYEKVTDEIYVNYYKENINKVIIISNTKSLGVSVNSKNEINISLDKETKISEKEVQPFLVTIKKGRITKLFVNNKQYF